MHSRSVRWRGEQQGGDKLEMCAVYLFTRLFALFPTAIDGFGGMHLRHVSGQPVEERGWEKKQKMGGVCVVQRFALNAATDPLVLQTLHLVCEMRLLLSLLH